jgi:hypothetical protein
MHEGSLRVLAQPPQKDGWSENWERAQERVGRCSVLAGTVSDCGTRDAKVVQAAKRTNWLGYYTDERCIETLCWSH